MHKDNRLTAENILELLGGTDDTFVETGTYRAVTTLAMSKVFKHVHSIELSETLYDEAKEKCKGVENIQLHHGDSAMVLPTLDLPKPVVFLLDAHACKTKPLVTAQGAFPLWKELEYIGQRPCRDIIIVDDVHAFGKHNERANSPEWIEVTTESIIDAIEIYKPVIDRFEFHDTFVMYV